MIPALALAVAALMGTYSASGNFAVDLNGPVDTRPGTWGTADAWTWKETFSPPAGYRVRILAIQGDLTAMARTLPEDPPVPRGKSAGVLLGFGTTAAEGSVRCSPCADNTMLYVQAAMGSEPVTRSFDWTVRAGGLLEPDNTLLVKVASWLNTTGIPVHLEATFTIVYRFEPPPAGGQ